MASAAEVIPGQSRVIAFQVNGHQFGFRRPTRGDVRESARVFASKLTVSGIPTESDILNNTDGFNLQWEARLEIGLMPRRMDGGTIDLGETCPSHWVRSIKDRTGGEIGRVVSFDDVDPEEFAAVVAHVEAELGKKNSSVKGNSTEKQGGGSVG